ncbi:MAG: LpqB family beta-propeller domain-containing protein [Phycisphaerales bacterium]
MRAGPAIALLLAACLAQPAPARQPVEPVPSAPEPAQPPALSADAAVADVRLSPDGGRLAFIAPRPCAPAQVYVAPVEQPRAATGLGADTFGALEVAWSLAGDRLIVALPGAQDGARLLRSVPAPGEPGEAIDLTDASDRARLQSRAQRRPDEALVIVETPAGAPPSAWVVDLTTGARRLAMRNPGAVQGGVVTGYVAARDLAGRLLQVRTPEGGVRLLRPAPFIFGAMPFEAILAWTPDEAARSRALGFDATGRILYAIDARPGEPTLVALDAETGDVATLVSAGAPVTGVLRAPSGVCLGVWTSDPAAPFVAIDRAVEPDMQALRAFESGDIRIVNQRADGGVWLVAYEQGGGERVWAAYDRTSRMVRRLF